MKQVTIIVTMAVLLGFSGLAMASQIDNQEKVTICHRTNSVTNPYVKITVDESAVDGEGKNDHTHHTGPLATSQAVAQTLKDAKVKWGDIIPNKLNWSSEGQEILRNGCKVPESVPSTQSTPNPENPSAPQPSPVPITTATELPATGAH